MFEKFTDSSRHVVVLAQEFSRDFDHDFIGREHLFLAVLSDHENLGAHGLAAVGIHLDSAVPAIRDLAPPTQPPKSHIPFTDGAKDTLQGALQETDGSEQIGAEHITLSLLRAATEDPESILGQYFAQIDVDPEDVAEIVRASIDRHADPVRSRALTHALAIATRMSGGVTGTHHLLAALLQDPDSAAARLLAEGGFDVTKLETAPLDADVAGTSDA